MQEVVSSEEGVFLLKSEKSRVGSCIILGESRVTSLVVMNLRFDWAQNEVTC